MSTNPVPMQFVYSNFSLRKICSLALQMDGPTVFCFCLFLSLLLNYFLGIHSQSEITESKCMNTFMAFCLYCQIAITKGCTLVFCHQLYGILAPHWYHSRHCFSVLRTHKSVSPPLCPIQGLCVRCTFCLKCSFPRCTHRSSPTPDVKGSFILYRESYLFPLRHCL